MPLRTLIPLLLLASSVSRSDPQTSAPERLDTKHSVISRANPALQVNLPKSSHFLGADRWVLYDVADCEVHVFVDADARHIVQRLYWVQFEHYLPRRPELKYDYTRDNLRHVNGRDLFLKARFGPTDDAGKPDSDLEHVRRLVRAAGYTMPPGIINVRIVYLPTPDHRGEVMVIYAEDAALSGVTWNDLLPGGVTASRWPSLREEVIGRAFERVLFSGPATSNQ